MEACIGCISEKGNYRKKNQDRAICRKAGNGTGFLAVACICDGIGSFAQSEIAAEMVTAGVLRWFDGMCGLYPGTIDEESMTEDLEFTLRELNELVYNYRGKKGIDIGCTMSTLCLTEKNYYIFHVGDSKIVRPERSEFLTRDEVSVVESDGRVKTLLANYMGKSDELWLNKGSGSLEAEAMFLLGSDGLFKRMPEEGLLACAEAKPESDEEAEAVCRRLAALVTERGERDNISCILLRVIPTAQQQKKRTGRFFQHIPRAMQMSRKGRP